jgi:serine/threonine-protein kinase HipA
MDACQVGKDISLFRSRLPGGRYRLTPLHDALIAQPGLDAGQIQRKQMKFAMSVGNNRHYLIDEIVRRHLKRACDAPSAHHRGTDPARPSRSLMMR